MAYQVLARKWRPQRFADLIGQEPIVTALQNALTEGRIAQAYLFSGIRGIGKTTAARLLAKALNCERGPTAEPCNECTACIEITRGSDLDVIEVDAATYSKVEQVRELTESLKYGPARDRYKVAVLDEIHRLSRQAFDALLKIVEEPPDHLVFIFATTEADAVPATVLSRCQEFGFRRVPAERVVHHLREICGAEGITAGAPALRLIARAGEGSVRDAVALLDQLATFGSGTVADEDAARLLGGLDAGLLHDLLQAILASRRDEVSRAVRRLEDEGWDPRQAFVHLLGYCRDALHLAMGRPTDEIDLPVDDAAALAATARGAGYENLLRLLHQLLASEPNLRRSEAPFLALEVAWLRAAELPKLTRIEELLGGGPAAAETAAETAREPAPPAAARREAPAAAAGRPRPAGRAAAAAAGRRPPAERPSERPAAGGPGRSTADAEAPAADGAAAAERGNAGGGDEPGRPGTGALAAGGAKPDESRTGGGDAAPSDPGGAVAAFLETVGQRKQVLAAHVAEAERLAVEGGRLLIYAPPGDPWLGRALARPQNRRLLDEAVAATWGEGAGWELLEGGAEPAGAAESEAPEEPPSAGTGPAAVAGDPAVQRVLELFQGKVEEVEEVGGGDDDGPREDGGR